MTGKFGSEYAKVKISTTRAKSPSIGAGFFTVDTGDHLIEVDNQIIKKDPILSPRDIPIGFPLYQCSPSLT
jgi:hypothetical protein